MLRSIQVMMCIGVFGLALVGCSKSETTLSGPVTPDAIQVAQEEERKAQDAELAEQRKSMEASR